ncbi:DNA-directed RNA polymerase subunit H [Candidatus Pacearchaeota archaeon]|nr:DNA-directed RNA polymerase subunit H [Candidatus Pacearchaeota archaeon]
MHILQPKHTKLKPEEVERLISELNISLVQLPKIRINDPALPEGCNVGDVIRIERKTEEGKKSFYYRVISV